MTTTEQLIEAAGTRSADDVRRHARPLVQYSAARRKLNSELRRFLYKNLYYNPVVHEPNLRAVQMLEELFNHYVSHPKDIGEQAKENEPAKWDGDERFAITWQE